MSASPSILALLALLPLAAADNGVEFQFGDPPPDGVLCNPALAGATTASAKVAPMSDLDA